MLTYHLTGRIGEDGELRVRLPQGVPPGEVEVIVTVLGSPAGDWTDDEIRQMMQVKPKTGAEIAALLEGIEAGFQHITDSAAWVEEQRRRRKEMARW